MTELEELKRQKREIEAKIREMKNQSVRIGDAKLDIEHYPTDKPDRHYVALNYKPIDGRLKWVSIASTNSRAEVIEKIPKIVDDLMELYRQVKQEK